MKTLIAAAIAAVLFLLGTSASHAAGPYTWHCYYVPSGEGADPDSCLEYVSNIVAGQNTPGSNCSPWLCYWSIGVPGGSCYPSNDSNMLMFQKQGWDANYSLGANGWFSHAGCGTFLGTYDGPGDSSGSGSWGVTFGNCTDSTNNVVDPDNCSAGVKKGILGDPVWAHQPLAPNNQPPQSFCGTNWWCWKLFPNMTSPY